MYVIALTTVTSGFLLATSEFIQPMLRIASLDVIYFGIIYAIMRMTMGVGGFVVHYSERLLDEKRLLLFGVIVIVLGYLGFYLGTGIIIILSVFLLAFAEGFNRIILVGILADLVGVKNIFAFVAVAFVISVSIVAGLFSRRKMKRAANRNL